MVASGAEITFDVQGTTGDLWPRTVAGVRQGVIDALTPFFDVADVSLTTSSVYTDPLHALSLWPYSATVRATMRSDYGDIRDVDSVIANAFYNSAGEVPTVTARGLEQGQNAADNRQGFSLTGTLLLVLAALVAIIIIKAE